MSKMRFGVCYGTSDNGDHHQNQAQRLSGLGNVDIAGNLYLRTDTYYSCGNKQQDKNKNQDPYRSDMPKLRKQVAGVAPQRQGGMSMKKINKSLILPIIYAAASLIELIYTLKDRYFGEFIDLASLVMLPASIAAIILIVIFKLNLKKNFWIYIISILVSATGIVISLFTGGILIFIVSIPLLIAPSIIYWLRKARKSEIIVWLLLDPVLYYFISLLLLASITMY